MQLDAKKVSVVGLGVSGLAAAHLAREQGATVTAMDERAVFASELLHGLHDVGIETILGRFDEQRLCESDLVVLSPGVPPTAPALIAARAKGVAFIGELELGMQCLATKCRPPVIAVTGTNGKTTTTSLIGYAAERCGQNVFVGGNIGNPVSNLARAVCSGKEECPDFLVLEVSSYQLESIVTFRPRIALILNFSLNHQDRYEQFDDYVQAKARLFMNMGEGDTLLLNRNDAQTPALIERARRQKIAVIQFDDAGESLPQLPGRHNRENLAAARRALQMMGLSDNEIYEAWKGFRPVPHRLERVADLNGVGYFNDSKATTVHATAAALEALEKNILWIGGGYEQNENFEPLRTLLPSRVSAAFFVGASGPRLQRELGNLVPAQSFEKLEQALLAARGRAKKGDQVLFSPAAKSFDSYKNFEERGEHFRRLVQALGQGGTR